jgi:DNA transformation protein
MVALPNLGPKSQEMLSRSGIHSEAQLRKLGAVAAYVQVLQTQPKASLNLLWALEGALTGLPWQEVARHHRTSLLLALEQCQVDRRGAKGVKGAKKAQAAKAGNAKGRVKPPGTGG